MSSTNNNKNTVATCRKKIIVDYRIDLKFSSRLHYIPEHVAEKSWGFQEFIHLSILAEVDEWTLLFFRVSARKWWHECWSLQWKAGFMWNWVSQCKSHGAIAWQILFPHRWNNLAQPHLDPSKANCSALSLWGLIWLPIALYLACSKRVPGIFGKTGRQCICFGFSHIKSCSSSSTGRLGNFACHYRVDVATHVVNVAFRLMRYIILIWYTDINNIINKISWKIMDIMEHIFSSFLRKL